MTPAGFDADAHCRRLVTELASLPLLHGANGDVLARLGDGAIPRLVAFTHEDKDAKGLRKVAADAAPQPPIHFTVLERLAEVPVLLLTAPPGGGKTVLAQDLALRLASARLGHDVAGITVSEDVDRNDLGDVLTHLWDGPVPPPFLVQAAPGDDVATLLTRAGVPAGNIGPALLIIDDLDRAPEGFLSIFAGLNSVQPVVRIVALADAVVADSWVLPAGVTRHGLLPLPVAQRRRALQRLSALRLSRPNAAHELLAGNPALFALALAAPGAADTAEDLVDLWLAAGPNGERAPTPAAALATLSGDDADDLPAAVRPRNVRELLAARALVERPDSAIAQAFGSDPRRMEPVVLSLAHRMVAAGRSVAPLALELLALEGDAGLHGALVAGAVLRPGDPAVAKVVPVLIGLIEAGALTARARERAGRLLSAWDDPRDLDALAQVPGGRFFMGSDMHPNSAPPHEVSVAPFRIGIYPVTNGQYHRFIAATGRLWRSPEQDRPERRSAPATDLTWRDARAYCAWLTDRWRTQGRIGPDEIVRLPSEPEWERAARGDQPVAPGREVYPWGGGWRADAANSDEAGFNETCTVGIFPAGRGPYGCRDMAGHVWEWCTTLWGDDMARPSLPYPYTDDGRESLEAGPTIRRVLRGGCFSSGAAKANCTYRGSLEPDGFWRGNGFRIVVAGV